MADSTHKTTDELEHQRVWDRGGAYSCLVQCSTKTTSPRLTLLKLLAFLSDVVIQGFRRLSIKYRWSTDQYYDLIRTFQETRSTFSSDQATTKESILNQLQFCALPKLHFQITNLSHSLKPLGLQKAPESKFEILLDIQSEIEAILDLIIRLTYILYPEPTYAVSRADDQHLKQFKSYRLRILKAKYFETCENISLVFREAYEVLQKMKHSPEKFSQLVNTADFPGNRSIGNVFESIKWTIKCIKGNELEVAQNSWQADFGGIHYSFQQIMTLVNPESYSTTDNQESRSKLSREPVFHLAKLAIPLIKISKLFFTKLSKCGLNKTRLPLFTEMASEQIESLANSLGQVTRDIIELGGLLPKADDGDATGQDFVKIADKLRSRYEAPLVALLLYVIPSIPDSDDGFPTQSYYRTWLVTWNTQRILATVNFINAAKLFSGVEPM
ncbi:hypothetical protein PGTUg99_023661 [Puccinia graminis f. sp. tritici]|uniref:Uncharacterized protein n=1 Tax=Puccinia graminis f. sp. tritici TaxID=56615 RepID=A0A5B0RR16_PUCGR|nr:hypothetical protein PGTUg99_023661 [Puccinia graminis f. sp. tritici]